MKIKKISEVFFGGSFFGRLFFSLLCMNMIFACSGITFKKTDISLERSDKSIVPLRVELAVTEEQQAQGFMRRRDIPAGTGMLFVFDRDQIASFWMKDTPHALSIAYIDSSGRIRDIFEMKPYSLQSVYSTVSVRYALEVPSGWFAEQNIQEGDRLVLPISGL